MASELIRNCRRITENAVRSVYEVALADVRRAVLFIERDRICLVNDRVRLGHRRNFGIVSVRVLYVPLAAVVKFVDKRRYQRKVGAARQVRNYQRSVFVVELDLIEIFKGYVKVFFERYLVSLVKNFEEAVDNAVLAARRFDELIRTDDAFAVRGEQSVTSVEMLNELLAQSGFGKSFKEGQNTLADAVNSVLSGFDKVGN